MEERASKIKGAISLAQGIPSFTSHPLIRERVIRAIESGLVDKYSSVAGLPELRELISKNLDGHYSAENEIMVTGGAVEALSSTISALFEKGDELIVLTPAYPYYSRICQMTGVKFIPVKLDEKRGWSIPFNDIISAITSDTKGIVICNPNNPTGTVLSKEDLIEIGELSLKNDLIIILDDVYEDISFKGSIFNLYSEISLKERLIRIVSLSKSFALSGWRIGYLHGPQLLLEKILRIHDNLINCAPVVSQYAALGALENKNEIVPAYLKTYIKRRDIMENHLKEMKEFLDFHQPSGAYYYFPRIKGMDDSEKFCIDMLDKVGLAIVPGAEFGPGGENHVRICFGRSEQDIDEGMARMKRYFNETKRSL